MAHLFTFSSSLCACGSGGWWCMHLARLAIGMFCINVLFLKKWFLRNEISQRMARQIKTNFINEWRGEAESWVYEICFDLPSHELWYFISQKPLFQKFHFNFLYKELDNSYLLFKNWIINIIDQKKVVYCICW